jgi:hypothetical protein
MICNEDEEDFVHLAFIGPGSGTSTRPGGGAIDRTRS